MIKRIFYIFSIILIIFSNNNYAKQNISVLILPFSILASQELKYLEYELPRVIENHLIQEGADIVKYKGDKYNPDDLKSMAETGINNHSDYVIWGSFNKNNDKFQLNIFIIKSNDINSYNSFSDEIVELESLYTVVQKLSKKISSKLFDVLIVEKIIIKGNERIESDAILKLINTKPGDQYLPKQLTDDIKKIFKMGYFDDIKVEADISNEGKYIVCFTVKEKPTVRNVILKGMRVYDEEKIQEVMDISKGSILNLYKVKENIKRIEHLYKEKNYHNVEVLYELVPQKNKQSDIVFNIKEGKKVLIKTIKFEGNNAYTDKELKKIIATKEKGFFSFLTSSGEMDSEKLNQDAMRIGAHYHNNGYIDSRVSDPKIVIKEQWIEIEFKIIEGKQFRIGKIDISGDLIKPKENLLKYLKLEKNGIYNSETIRNDLMFLTDIYSNEGYAYADISPLIKKDDVLLTVNITYNIEKGKQVYFDRIIIHGNSKTRDKVIRRELRVYEQDLYRGILVKQSIRNLHRLDYFEDVQVDTIPGSSPDKMNLKLEVKEKPTGMFSFGGGYSSVDDAFIVGSITQRNLFGRGQTLEAKGQLGGSTNQFNISFTEPYLFDTLLSAGIDAYNWTREYDEYDKDSVGGRLSLGYPIWRYTKFYVSYSYDISEIDNIDESDAPSSIIELQGENVTSSSSFTIRYDSRDRLFNPTEGSDHSFTYEYAGDILGGDIGFNKYVARAGKYFPLFWNFVFFLHSEAGYVKGHSDKIVPDYELFHLGGINSLRGFEWEDLCPIEITKYSSNKGDVFYTYQQIGGNKFVQFNAELIVPIVKDVGLMGVIFYDTGNVYKKNVHIDFSELRKSAGFGFRWYSPIGPIRLEHGYILDRKEGETSGRWEFSMGSVF